MITWGWGWVGVCQEEREIGPDQEFTEKKECVRGRQVLLCVYLDEVPAQWRKGEHCRLREGNNRCCNGCVCVIQACS